jgi:hypothetical protein
MEGMELHHDEFGDGVVDAVTVQADGLPLVRFNDHWIDPNSLGPQKLIQE